MIKKIYILILACFILFFSFNCYAQHPGRKLGRAVTNILTGWVELPKNIYETKVEEDMFAALTMGIAKGVGMTIVRIGAGVYELITFPFPIPEHYQPILEPEFIFSK